MNLKQNVTSDICYTLKIGINPSSFDLHITYLDIYFINMHTLLLISVVHKTHYRFEANISYILSEIGLRIGKS